MLNSNKKKISKKRILKVKNPKIWTPITSLMKKSTKQCTKSLKNSEKEKKKF